MTLRKKMKPREKRPSKGSLRFGRVCYSCDCVINEVFDVAWREVEHNCIKSLAERLRIVEQHLRSFSSLEDGY